MPCVLNSIVNDEAIIVPKLGTKYYCKTCGFGEIKYRVNTQIELRRLMTYAAQTMECWQPTLL